MTLTGAPDARELPLYGSKCLAVREGTVQMVGQPKLPTYTFLAATAAPGDKSITIAGEVNWAVGDVIAIASSSFIGGRSVLANKCMQLGHAASFDRPPGAGLTPPGPLCRLAPQASRRTRP